MHRLTRCLPTLVTAAVLGSFFLSSLFISCPSLLAQGDAPTAVPNAAAPNAAASNAAAPNAAAQPVSLSRSRNLTRHKHYVPKTVGISGRLAVRMRLGDGRQTWHPTRQQIGIGYAPGGTDSSPSGAFQFVVNRAALRRYLDGIAPYIRRAPKNARVVVGNIGDDSGTAEVPAHIVPGYSGATLNVSSAVDLIQKTIQANPSTVHIVLPLETKPAKVSETKLRGIDARIGYFVTRFNPGDEGRTATVRRAITIIDGTIVPPGAIFSVDQTVGPRDPEHGFTGKGHVFINGHMELQSGGGMCQVATTIFNAAMLADLKIVERHQHVRTVPYVDPGRDATIYHGEKDFRLQNNTDAPIYISYKTTYSHAIVSIFGHGVPGRRVKLVASSERLAERHYIGSFSRIVYNPDGTVQRDPPFKSNYKWPPTLDYSR